MKKDLKHTATPTQKFNLRIGLKKNLKGLKARTLTETERRDILKDYFFDKTLSSTDIVKKYKITPTQLYDGIIRELNVSGTVATKMVLNPKKYAKVDVKGNC